MTRSNAGRPVGGGRAVPHFPQSPRVEGAKHVRTVAGRFLKDTASFNDLVEACRLVVGLADAERDAPTTD